MTTGDDDGCTCHAHGMSPDIPQCGRCGEHGDGVCADEDHEEPMPERIQRRRTKGWRMPEGTVYVGRGSKWGNPFVVGEHLRVRTPFDAMGGVMDARLAVDMYRILLGWRSVPITSGFVTLPMAWAARELRGKNLACWCPLTDAQGNHVPCHADVLLELANPTAPVGDTDTTPKETK